LTTPLISVRHAKLVYPVLSVRAQSLRNSVLNVAVGGRLLQDGRDVIHVRALDDISFDVGDGERLGIMGHNGSGKTTLLKVLAGVYEPTSGSVQVRGEISSMLDIGLGLDPEVTGLENIFTMGRMRGFSEKQVRAKIPEILEFTDLGGYIHLPMKTYSAGMGMRLVFGVATSFSPDILLLDEWLGAGDAAFFEKARERMNNLLDKSRCMVLASHSFELIKSVCTTLMVLEAGQVRYYGEVGDRPPEFFGRQNG
jgi:ABC-type polysaccharide/polyol phosphate transport system ATPase subunit